jgi:hypothetical protein
MLKSRLHNEQIEEGRGINILQISAAALLVNRVGYARFYCVLRGSEQGLLYIPGPSN